MAVETEAPVEAAIVEEPVVVTIPAAVEPIVEAEPIAQAVEPAPVVSEPAPIVEVAAPAPVATENATVDALEVQKIESAPAPVAEPVDIDAALAGSGLVMVQTTAAPVAMAPAELPVKLGRPRKQKPVSENTDSEPLVMVETGK